MSSSGAKGQPCPGRHGGIPVKVDNDGEVTMIKNFFVRSASIAAIAALAPVAAVYAQVTTSNVRGVVTDSAGQPVAGASVAIVHEPTGTVTTTTTGLSGQYSTQNLRVGGPFSFTVSGEGISTSRVENVFTSLGDTSVVNIVTAADDGTARLETVVVTGSASVAQVATGPSATFNLNTLENVPAISRDLKDVLRLDPIRFPETYSFRDILRHLPRELERRGRRSRRFLGKIVLVDPHEHAHSLLGSGKLVVELPEDCHAPLVGVDRLREPKTPRLEAGHEVTKRREALLERGDLG